MLKLRLLYEITGKAKYMSHLDTMQVFRRSFARAEIPVSFTEGFNPHPYLSIALPLPTCFESVCELLDFDLESDKVSNTFLFDLNRALPEGITVMSVFGRIRAPKHIEYVSYDIEAEGVIDTEAVSALFERKGVMIMKRSKSGESEVDVTDYIKGLSCQKTENGAKLSVLLTTGAKTLNPEYIIRTIEKYVPETDIEFVSYRRTEVYDRDMKPFRS